LDKQKKGEIENEIKKTQDDIKNAEKEIKAEKEAAGEDKDDQAPRIMKATADRFKEIKDKNDRAVTPAANEDRDPLPSKSSEKVDEQEEKKKIDDRIEEERKQAKSEHSD